MNIHAENEMTDVKNSCVRPEQKGQPSIPPELGDREVYNTPIGPVCMSRTEHEAYLEELEWQKLKKQK